jgi:hypothetical protein
MVGYPFDYYFPVMRGSTVGRWVVTLAIGACGGRSLDPSSGQGSIQDAGVEPASIDGSVTHIAPTHVLTAVPVDAVTIAADESGVFGMTSDNAVWALPARGEAPQIVARDTGARFPSCNEGGRMITAGNDLFWVASRALSDHHWMTVLHRTSKDGSRDEVVADDLLIDDFITLVADDTSLYWNDIVSVTEGGARIRAFPRNAPIGTPPVTVATVPTGNEIASVAVNEQSLYWTPFRAIGSTAFPGELWTGAKRALAAGDSTSARQLSSASARGLVTHGDDLFFTYLPDLWSARFARWSAAGEVIDLVELKDGLDSLVFVDRWAILSISGGSCGRNTRRLVAVPTSAGSGPPTTIAEGAVTPVALGAEGITFVNAQQQLVAISRADLNVALTASP